MIAGEGTWKDYVLEAVVVLHGPEGNAGVVLRVEPIERAALPAWIAQRLARQGQRVQAGEAGRRPR